MLERSQPFRDSEASQLAGFLFARWGLIAASVVVAVGAALIVASWQGWYESGSPATEPDIEIEAQPPVYAAMAVYNAVPSLDPGLEPDASVAIGRHLARSYQFILGTPSVAQLIVDQLELEIDAEHVQSALTFASSPDLSIITVTAVAEDPALAIRMANGISEALSTSEAYGELDLGDLRGGLMLLDRARQAPLLDSGVEPEPAAESSNEPRNVLAPTVATAAAIGLLLGIAAAVGLDRIGGRAHYPEQVVEVSGLNPLGRIDSRKRYEVDMGGALGDMTGREPFRFGAAVVKRMKTDRTGGVSLLVTSPGRREGKTTIVAGLAGALAEDGSSVVIVSGDLRSPLAVEDRLDQVRPEQTGLSEYLTDPSLTIDELLEPRPASGVRVIPRGKASGHSAVSALGSDRMRGLLDGLKSKFDWVLLDSPGALDVADAVQVSCRVDGTILVVDGGRSRLSSVEATVQRLRMAGANLTGFFHNRPRPIPLTRNHGYSV